MRAHGVAGTELLGRFRNARLAAQTGRIEQAHRPVAPLEVGGDGIAREPRLRPGDHALLAEQRIDQRRLAGVGPADHGHADRAGLVVRLDAALLVVAGAIRATLGDRLQAERGQDGRDQFADTLAMLGRYGDRLAETEPERLVEPVGARAPLALVGNQHDRPARGTHRLGEGRVGRHHAVTRIEHEQHDVGLADRRLALGAHARRDRARRRLFQPRRVDDSDRVASQHRLALAPVAREARHVRHQRRAPGRQAIEQGRLADIGPADDGDDGGHGSTATERAWRAAPTRIGPKFN